MKNILVVEDNQEMKILLQACLEEYLVDFVETVAATKEILKNKNFDLIILDVGLPDGDGLKLFSEMSLSHEIYNQDTPVIFLSGKTEISNKILAFSMGAEDYISKPFDPLELRARISSKLRKRDHEKQKNEELSCGDLFIEVSKQAVWITTKVTSSVLDKIGQANRSGKSNRPDQSTTGLGTTGLGATAGKERIRVDLTSLEFRLLLALASHPEKIYDRETLLQKVWGDDISVTDRTVDTHMANLRKKLAKSKCKIETVIGAGYRFMVNKPVDL